MSQKPGMLEAPESPPPAPSIASVRDRYQDLVREWQGPVYGLCLKMLRHEADAADATQEVFVRVFRYLPGYDQSREFRPWLFRLATRVIYRFIQESKRREEKEAAVVLRPPEGDLTERVEQAELEHHLSEGLGELPAEARALLLLHFYEGLSQREVAEVLSVPRTTIASRLEKALEKLRSHLGRVGCLCAVPQIELALRTSGAPEVPAALSRQLLSIAARSAEGTSLIASSTLGGILMSKSIVLSLAIVTVVSLGVGWGIGSQWLTSSASSSTTARDSASTAARSESVEHREKLEGELSQLRMQLADSESQRADLARSLEEKDALLAEQSQRLEQGGAATEVASDPAAIDWAQVSAAFTDNAALLSRIAELYPEGGMRALRKGLTPEEQAAMQQLMQVYAGAALKARTQTPYPILDEEMLPELMQAVFGGTLELEDGQLDGLAQASLDLLAEYGHPDPLTPLQVYEARQKILGGITDSFGDMLTEAQQGQWAKLRPATDLLLEGDVGNYSFGMSANYQSEFLDHWTDHYGLSPEQRTGVTPMVTRYADAGRDLLTEYQQLRGPSQRSLTAEEQAQMQARFRALQMEFEREVVPRLSEAQLEALHRQNPMLIQFTDSGDINLGNRRWGGF